MTMGSNCQSAYAEWTKRFNDSDTWEDPAESAFATAWAWAIAHAVAIAEKRGDTGMVDELTELMK